MNSFTCYFFLRGPLSTRLTRGSGRPKGSEFDWGDRIAFDFGERTEFDSSILRQRALCSLRTVQIAGSPQNRVRATNNFMRNPIPTRFRF